MLTPPEVILATALIVCACRSRPSAPSGQPQERRTSTARVADVGVQEQPLRGRAETGEEEPGRLVLHGALDHEHAAGGDVDVVDGDGVGAGDADPAELARLVVARRHGSDRAHDAALASVSGSPPVRIVTPSSGTPRSSARPQSRAAAPAVASSTGRRPAAASPANAASTGEGSLSGTCRGARDPRPVRAGDAAAPR